MKLPPLEYVAPTSVAETVALLAQAQGDAKIISGGQSLMPMLAFRLASPKILIDLRHVPDLDRITVGDDGVTLGAKVRWVDIEQDLRLRTAHPLLADMIKHVAHYQIRNRGTVGGSLAHADPAAEMPAIAVTCDAALEIAGPEGSRTVPAASFFIGPLLAALGPSDMIVAVRLPAWPARRRRGLAEFARRKGDFAMAGVALFYDLDADGRMEDPHVGAFGVADTPLRLREVESVLAGKKPEPAVFARAVETCRASVDPPSDIHADSDYRRALLGTMLEQAMLQAERQSRDDA
ncbi:MAG TPA: xanthine dehydrogenase family protein subunit M [Pseudolabrys sp.]